MRSNYNYAMLAGEQPTFGTCKMKIADRKAEPPVRARGQIARTYFYMADAYGSRYHMNKQQEQSIASLELTVEKIQSGSEIAQKSGEALQRIVTIVDETSGNVYGIATASEQQSSTSE